MTQLMQVNEQIQVMLAVLKGTQMRDLWPESPWRLRALVIAG